MAVKKKAGIFIAEENRQNKKKPTVTIIPQKIRIKNNY